MSRKRRLTDEERVLWSRVARTAVPLEGKAYPDIGETQIHADAGEPQPETVQEKTVPPVKDVSARPPRAPSRLDAPTRQKLARGRLSISGRVDLHGMTQEEAHVLLLSVLRQAYNEDRRYVLVITGKGSAVRGGGVLRRTVPHWLSTPPFRTLVSGYEEAARNHGGEGALYVRLRRRRAQP